LDRLPKEIRQKIYGYCLEVDKPVCVKQCCGPNSTRRERASCKKHGDNCSKIGKGNGLTLYDEDQDDWEKAYGRFNILTLSRTIYEEACWVLHVKGSALIQSTEALQAYLSEAQCTFTVCQTMLLFMPNVCGCQSHASATCVSIFLGTSFLWTIQLNV
jgi:hypothetical protein